ncbi:MAG TPA: MerR family transcriptional regulator [Plantibacter sp.]|uniref:helix-turn-helix domain-containing protein n=1 Tax=unclassified Plantibacter TaxID=2624265 RepID=UPI002CA5E80A|nr:MerR family transcriptional regulator [Plantibacter sp.]
MRIGELARLTGIAPSAIRYYEERDMFSPGQILRSSSGYRDYTPAARQRLDLILAGRAAGLSLDRMRTQMANWDTMSDSARADLLDEQRVRLDEQIAVLTRSRDTVAAASARFRSGG